jgi:hypothetical protein
MKHGIPILLAVAIIAAGSGGCSRFEQANRRECLAAIDTIISLVAAEKTKDKPSHELLVRPLMKVWLLLSGEKRAAVRNCMVTKSRHEAICTAKAQSLKEVHRCGNW